MTGNQIGIGADGQRTDVPCLAPTVVRDSAEKIDEPFGNRFFDIRDPTMAAAPTASPI